MNTVYCVEQYQAYSNTWSVVHTNPDEADATRMYEVFCTQNPTRVFKLVKVLAYHMGETDTKNPSTE